MSALTLPSAAKASASAMSSRLPTKEPRMVMQFATTSNKRHGKIARRQSDQHAGAALARHADALLERAERRGGDQHAVGTAVGALLHRLDRIAVWR